MVALLVLATIPVTFICAFAVLAFYASRKEDQKARVRRGLLKMVEGDKLDQ